ncbi:SIR2 family NAD-dependent protein deacylase [Azospira sp. I09]|uniref:SIR2 family NAD-dependent protein deacylase n=1 Tax=Azospira sp. I09 TaxID=1765049 RepID=UPI001260EFF6|nr:SIR2 family protein [Azospira sp. I09]
MQRTLNDSTVGYYSVQPKYDNSLALTVNPMYAINDLSDYPAIRKLASALYKLDSCQHGAAIMIGAGFSRSAAHHVGGEKKMPLWNDFSRKLAAELNPDDKDISFLDPLRVAEEYRAYFGQAAFNDRIRSDIDDDAWRVGELYKSLLELPWSEIMTTNWDTLLERAAKDVHRPYYTPVTKPSDLAWAPSPRIVKLHGTIGITETFIGAQEDYRTYPTKFAPFVNFARQVFIENELCLLGFSGDDPNFLQWSGWVRDHLAGHARKIYLVGALNLTAARRKHLESMNVAPVDLWNAVKHVDDRDQRHRLAIELFLQALSVEGNSRLKPHEWAAVGLHRQQVAPDDHMRQFKEPEYAASLLSAQLEALRVSRESYPGWLLCPPSVRWQIRHQLNDPFPTAQNLAALSSDDRAKLLYEIAWRYGIMWEYIFPWLAEAMARVADPDEPCALSSRQQLEICVVLLRNSRWLTAESAEERQVMTQHVEALVAILERHARFLPDAAAELAYHKALTARDALDYAGMDAAVQRMVGEDRVWPLRQAALLMELGKSGEADQLIAKAYGDLREFHRRDRNSIPILSRLMWAHWLLESIRRGTHDGAQEKLPAFAESMYREWKCDPWTWIENIRGKAIERQEKYWKDRNPIEPSFEQGAYRDNSKRVSFSNETSDFLMLDGLTTNVGIPLRSGSAFLHVNLLAGTAEKLVLSGGIGVELWDYTLAIRAASSESSLSIKDVFTRVGVARMSKEAADRLVERVLKAIGYWCALRQKGTDEQQGSALTMLRVQMEVLARLVVRVSPEKAKEIFRLAISIGKQQDFQHHWLSEVIGGLITHSLDSIPKVDRGDLLPDILDFPLQCEVMGGNFPRWPNPTIDHLNARAMYLGLERRIDELIGFVATNRGLSRGTALKRLLPLARNGFLADNERQKLACALWGDPPDYRALPSSTNLLPHAMLFLPASDPSQVKRQVYHRLYEHGEDLLTRTQADLRVYPSPEIDEAASTYIGMANAAVNDATRLFPTAEHALVLFDRLVMYRPTINGDEDFLRDARRQVVESIGNALSYAITPALSDDAKTVERFACLRAFIDEAEGAFSAAIALAYFTHINDEVATSVEQIIRKSLQRNDSREVGYAALTVNKWVELTNESSMPRSLERLIARVIVIIESGRTIGLQQLIWVAGELIEKQRLSQEQTETLIAAIPNLFAAMDYASIEPKSQEAISASSIREACVKVAGTLARYYPDDRALQDMLSAAKTDALPEVRFAVGPAS